MDLVVVKMRCYESCRGLLVDVECCNPFSGLHKNKINSQKDQKKIIASRSAQKMVKKLVKEVKKIKMDF